MQIRRLLLMLVLILIVFNLSITAAEEPLTRDNIILNQMEKLNLSQLQEEVDRINNSTENIFPRLDLQELLVNFVKGDLEISWQEIARSLLKYLGKEIAANLTLLGQILILGVISAVLAVFHNSFSSQAISKTASMLIFLVLAVLMLQSFKLAIDIGIQSVDYMVSFMQALLPVLLTLLVSIGGLTSAAIFHPLTYLIISLLVTVIKNIILPMIFISVVLNIVNNISDEFRISRLAGLFKEFSMGMLGLILLIFIGGLLLQGGAAALTDSLTLRTAKFLTGTFVPVIGKIFSDAVDLVVSCSLIIKNALNLFGVLAIILLITYPVIKIIALIFIYKIAGALIQPVADIRLVNMFNDLGNSLVLVLLVVIAVAFMFFICLTVIVGTANLTVMMR